MRCCLQILLASEALVRGLRPGSFLAVKYCLDVQLLYTGSGAVFGITSKDVSKGEWKEVALPDKNVKVC